MEENVVSGDRPATSVRWTHNNVVSAVNNYILLDSLIYVWDTNFCGYFITTK